METTLSATTEPQKDILQHPIVFFDGVCGLCNRFVDIIVASDRDGIFRFAPIQGDTARALLPPLSEVPEAWSMAYLDEHGIREESDAALEVCRRLGGVWGLLSLARVIPRFIRHPVYCTIARYRYRWFGKKDVCRIPTPEERTRFLP